METISSIQQPTQTSNITVQQFRESLQTQNLAAKVIDAFNLYVKDKGLNDNSVLGPDNIQEIVARLQQTGEKLPASIIPENVAAEKTHEANAKMDNTNIEEKNLPNLSVKSQKSFSEKAFRKDTPPEILQKAQNGTLTKEEAKLWATTTTIEGRNLLGISGRMDAHDKEILIKRDFERKKALENSQPKPEESLDKTYNSTKESFFNKAARSVTNAITWPIRGLMSLFGAKKTAEKLKWNPPTQKLATPQTKTEEMKQPPTNPSISPTQKLENQPKEKKSESNEEEL